MFLEIFSRREKAASSMHHQATYRQTEYRPPQTIAAASPLFQSVRPQYDPHETHAPQEAPGSPKKRIASCLPFPMAPRSLRLLHIIPVVPRLQLARRASPCRRTRSIAPARIPAFSYQEAPSRRGEQCKASLLFLVTCQGIMLSYDFFETLKIGKLMNIAWQVDTYHSADLLRCIPLAHVQ